MDPHIQIAINQNKISHFESKLNDYDQLEVFKYLSVVELIRVQRVSRQLQQASERSFRSRQFLTNQTLDNKRFENERQFKNVMSRFGERLEYLDLNVFDSKFTFINVAICEPDVANHIKNVRIPKDWNCTLVTLGLLIRWSPNLEHLSLRLDDGLLLEPIKKLKCLKSLEIIHFNTSYCVHRLLRNFESYMKTVGHRLRSLSVWLDFDKYSDWNEPGSTIGFDEFYEGLTYSIANYCQNLIYLKLYRPELRLNASFAWLRTLKHLETLEVTFENDANIGKVLNAVPWLQKLEYSLRGDTTVIKRQLY